jgi:hypothetical protein
MVVSTFSTHCYLILHIEFFGSRPSSLNVLPPVLRIRLLHLDPNPTLRVNRNMRLDPNLLDRLPAVRRRPCHRRLSFRVRIHVQRDRLERLYNPRYDGGSLVISELLAETDTGAGVEGRKMKGLGNRYS